MTNSFRKCISESCFDFPIAEMMISSIWYLCLQSSISSQKLQRCVIIDIETINDLIVGVKKPNKKILDIFPVFTLQLRE